jgi:hypothetical protein
MSHKVDNAEYVHEHFAVMHESTCPKRVPIDWTFPSSLHHRSVTSVKVAGEISVPSMPYLLLSDTWQVVTRCLLQPYVPTGTVADTRFPPMHMLSNQNRRSPTVPSVKGVQRLGLLVRIKRLGLGVSTAPSRMPSVLSRSLLFQ